MKLTFLFLFFLIQTVVCFFASGPSVVPHYKDARPHHTRSTSFSSSSLSASNASGALVALQADFTGVSPPYVSRLQVVGINVTTGTFKVLSQLPFQFLPLGVAYDPIFVRYFAFDVEAYLYALTLGSNATEFAQITALLGRPLTGPQYANASDSVLTLVPFQTISSSIQSLVFYSIPLDEAAQPRSTTVPLLPDESIPSSFPSALASYKRLYFFTALLSQFSNATAQQLLITRLHTLDLSEPPEVRTLPPLELLPRVEYVSMLAFDPAWDCLVALVGFAESTTSLPSWVKIDYRTGECEALRVPSSYAQTNVFSAAYDDVAHEWHYISHAEQANRLTTVSLATGDVFSTSFDPDQPEYYYGGLFWQPFPR